MSKSALLDVVYDVNVDHVCSIAVILDSSYNPPTIGHLEIMLNATLLQPGTHNVHILITTSITNVEKDAATAKAINHRLALMKAFVADLKDKVSDPSKYRWTVLLFDDAPLFFTKQKLLLETYPNIQQFKFIMGDDTFLRFIDPLYYQCFGGPHLLHEAFCRFNSTARVIVYTRSCRNLEEFQLKYSKLKALYKEYEAGITNPEDIRALGERFANVSSTRARALLASGERDALARIVPPSVYKVIMSADY